MNAPLKSKSPALERIWAGSDPYSDVARDALERVVHNCFEAWGAPVSLQAFKERERRLRASRFARSNLEIWGLRVQGEWVCHCETVQLKLGGSSTPVTVVASLVTPQHLRGRGYASSLLRLLQGWDRPLLLYSEIAPAFYSRLGFRSVDLGMWELSAQLQSPSLSEVKAFSDFELLFSKPEGRLVFGSGMLHPDPDLLEWHSIRESFYREQISPHLPADHKRLWVSQSETSLWCSAWMADYKSSTLRCLYLMPDFPAPDLKAHLTSAAQYARGLGLKKVVGAITSRLTLPSDLPIRELPRKEELPMVWFPAGEGSHLGAESSWTPFLPLAFYF